MQVKAPEEQTVGIPYPEYVLRILFASFFPAVKTAVEFNYPLDTVKDMMTLALWREAKRKHSTINLISLIFGKSTRTVKALSARFNKGGFFNTTETNLMRRVEDFLRQRPMTMDELADRLPHSNEFDSTRVAVKALLRDGRIRELPSRHGVRPQYTFVPQHHDLYSDGDWEARIDALYEHFEAITETIRRRFLSDQPDSAAARTFSFKGRPEDVEAFREEFFDFLRTKLADIEAKAVDADDTELFSVYTGLTGVEK